MGVYFLEFNYTDLTIFVFNHDIDSNVPRFNITTMKRADQMHYFQNSSPLKLKLYLHCPSIDIVHETPYNFWLRLLQPTAHLKVCSLTFQEFLAYISSSHSKDTFFSAGITSLESLCAWHDFSTTNWRSIRTCTYTLSLTWHSVVNLMALIVPVACGGSVLSGAELSSLQSWIKWAKLESMCVIQ